MKIIRTRPNSDYFSLDRGQFPRVRLVVVPPFGNRTGTFVARMQKSRAFYTTVVNAPNLPHLNYEHTEGGADAVIGLSVPKATHHELDASEERDHQIFEAHYKFYCEQVKAARAEDEILMLVSGQYHEYTAPLYIAIQKALDISPRIVSFDQHFDCGGRAFIAAGFLRWMIDNQYLRAQDLTIVGAVGFEDRVGVENAPIKDIITAKLGPSFADSGIIPADFSLTRFAHECAEAYWNLPGMWVAEGARLQEVVNYAQRIVNIYFPMIYEAMWIERSGINLGTSARQIPITGDTLLSFDGDVARRGTRFARADNLHLYFDRLFRTNILAIHVSELDSPECHLNITSLVRLFEHSIQAGYYKLGDHDVYAASPEESLLVDPA